MSLPLDLLPQIIGSLDATDLTNCALVNHEFYRIARQLLFTHLVLCGETWRSKSRFLLAEQGAEFRQRVKKITFKIEDDRLSLVRAMFDAQLILHLVELVGDRLDAFCLQSIDDFGWDQFPDLFISLIAVKVLPHIHSLELIRIMRIPLLATLRHCTHLQTVRLGAMTYLIAPSEGDGYDKETLELGIPLVSSLVVDAFGKEDFGDDREGPTSLKHLILLVGASIRSLTLGRCCDPQFPLEWDFLHPFRDLRHSLLHLSFGTHLYETILDHMKEPGIKRHTKLDFWIFSHIQSITFSIPKGASPAGWELFSIRLAQSLNYPSRTPLITLKFVLHSIYYPERASSTSSLDNLVENGNFEIHVVARGGLDSHSFADIIEAFRRDLPSWDEAGKLKFWLGE